MKKPLVILTGPTAVGKTELSINLARKINGEIISADSAQVYKGLDIGSAKITREEMQEIPHHLIDILEPDQPFDVTIFQKLAKEAIEGIYERGHIPVVVGGTGFYIQALLYDIVFDYERTEKSLDDISKSADLIQDIHINRLIESVNKNLYGEDYLTSEGKNETSDFRTLMEKYIEKTDDKKLLYETLKTVDPNSAQIIHMNNYRKVIRALEFYSQYGIRISEHNKTERERESAYNSAYLVLNMDRSILYDRINRRVDIMRNSGLIPEVQSLMEKGLNKSMTSMQAIGYKEILESLERISLNNIETDSKEYQELMDEAFEKIKLNTRHFAKRQLTWFRRERDVIWLDKGIYNTEEQLLEKTLDILSEKGILTK